MAGTTFHALTRRLIDCDSYFFDILPKRLPQRFDLKSGRKCRCEVIRTYKRTVSLLKQHLFINAVFG